MKRLNDYLLLTIFILTILLAIVVGQRTYSGYLKYRVDVEEQVWQEMMERNAQAQSRVLEMEIEIESMQDVESLQNFINDIVEAAEIMSDDSIVFDNDMVSENDAVSENEIISDNETISDNEAISGDETISENEINSDDETISENDINSDDDTVSGNSLFWPPEQSLEDKRALRTSYEETQEINHIDRELIANNNYDFSDMKIACLGDSITAAANLEKLENYEQYSYPAKLKELLGAKEVYNLGIGGSSIGRYWENPFVERYTEIPEDTDIIIVMGGTNDGFCVSEKEFGSINSREYRTFCGDLDELMRGLRENYPDAVIFIVTPLPNILQGYLMSEKDYLFSQKPFVEIICRLAGEYDYELIDLYNSNLLDPHDVNVIANYIPDGVHGNEAGYQILAEYFAGKIIRYYNQREQ